MDLFLSREVDAAAAMTYNELAQVLETKNPKTGKLYQLSDLNVIKMEDAKKGAGTSMLEDEVFVRDDWIKDKKNQATAKKFLAASFKGWIYCRDHAGDCVKIVLKNGPALPGGHQKWMMNEINALIWPNKLGIGIADPTAFNRTAKIAKQFRHHQEGAVGRLPHRPRQGGRRATESARRRRARQEVEEGQGQGHRGREVGTRPRKGDPQCPF